MIWKSSLVGLAVVAVVVVALIAARWPGLRHAHPNALWHIVHDLCAPDEAKNRLPAPCVAVDLASGYAVLKDQSGRTQVLVIPTVRVSGIESPAVLGAEAPNYWQDAWAARGFLDRFAHRPVPRDDVAMAINSIYGRSQNQLHIHVDCVRADVKHALQANLGAIGPNWSDLRPTLAGGRYRAMWLPGEDLSGHNLFDLLASDRGARADMGRETMAVVPATAPSGQDGFVLLAGRADLASGDEGHAEAVQDHACRVLQTAG